MHASGFESVWLVVALLPGFISVRIRDFFLPPRRADAFDRWFEVVAFAVGNYLVAGTALLAWRWVGSGFHLAMIRVALSPPWWGLSAAVFLYLLSLSSVVVGGGVGWVACNDLHYRVARTIGITSRTGRDDVWQDTFADIADQWHLVHLADGRRAMGVARYFSDRGDKSSISLKEASWIGEDGSVIPVRGDGLLIADAADIQCVEFLQGEQP